MKPTPIHPDPRRIDPDFIREEARALRHAELRRLGRALGEVEWSSFLTRLVPGPAKDSRPHAPQSSQRTAASHP